MKAVPWIASILVATVFLVGFDASTESADPPPSSTASSSQNALIPSPELTEKRIEYRDALRQLYEDLEIRYMSGMLDAGQVMETGTELAYAELAVAATAEERQAAIAKLLEHAKKIEETAQALNKAGARGGDGLYAAIVGRLRIELLILETSQ